MTKIREFASSILLAVVTLVVSLVIAEFAWRALHGIPLASTDNLILQKVDIIRQATGSMQHDPLLGWRLLDGIRTGHFTTGELGIRMNSNRIEPLRTGGILATGDSMTAGSGVADDETWPARLEALLSKPVLNGAVGAYGVDQMVLRAEQLLPTVQPHTVLIGISFQDILRNNFSVYGGGYKPYFDIEDGKAVLKGVPVPRIEAGSEVKLGWLRSLLSRSYLADEAIAAAGLQDRWLHHGIRYREVHKPHMGAKTSCLLMDRLAARKRETGLRVVVVMMYGDPEIRMKPQPPFAVQVNACAKGAGLELVDTYPRFRALLDGGDAKAYDELWIDEGGRPGHFAPPGNQLVARLVADQLLAGSEAAGRAK